ncbi:MAG TPA: hypothetical protein PKK26_11865, partial [Candidatus Wallbacteria bacterium]|nr:hypothetical protein [Candidatus Wallbacteria bacterium]
MSEVKKIYSAPVLFVTVIFAIAGMAITGLAAFYLCPFLFELIKPVCFTPPKPPVSSLHDALDDIPFYVSFITSLSLIGAYLGGSSGFIFSKLNGREFSVLYSNFWPRLGYVALFGFLLAFMNSLTITFLLFRIGFIVFWPFIFLALAASFFIPAVIIRIARKKYI